MGRGTDASLAVPPDNHRKATGRGHGLLSLKKGGQAPLCEACFGPLRQRGLSPFFPRDSYAWRNRRSAETGIN
jgi:hypothetical protein